MVTLMFMLCQNVDDAEGMAQWHWCLCYVRMLTMLKAWHSDINVCAMSECWWCWRHGMVTLMFVLCENVDNAKGIAQWHWCLHYVRRQGTDACVVLCTDATSHWLRPWACLWEVLLPDLPGPERQRLSRTWAAASESMSLSSTAPIRWTTEDWAESTKVSAKFVLFE